jgi:KaiC/GvpD/RAD55 family RecA-like ATPase
MEQTVEPKVAIQRASSGDEQLDAFLSGGSPKGSLILLSGNPGTGKSTLAARFLYEGAKRAGENGIYASFAESKQSFYENMAGVGFDFAGIEKEGRFRFLEVFSASKSGMSEIAKYILEEMRRFEARRLVIDSYSAMAQALGDQYEGRQILHTFFSRIMRNMGCTTIVIGEQPTGEHRIGDTAEEFVADGVLNLKLTIPRELEIRKMRGTRLKTRNVLYTLDGGFHVVTTRLKVPEVAKKWVPIRDSNNLISTGSPDLDAVLGGGFPYGTCAILEVSTEVRVAEVRLLTIGLMLNFINQQRGVMMLPALGVSSRALKAALGPYTTEQNFDGYFRVPELVEPDFLESTIVEPPRYVIPTSSAEGTETEKDLTTDSNTYMEEYRRLKSQTGNLPILTSTAYESIESSFAKYPEKLMTELGRSMARVRSSGDLSLGIGRPTVTILSKVMGMVDWHLKLWKTDGVLLLQGVKPYTNVYAVDCDVSKGYPVMTLKTLT